MYKTQHFKAVLERADGVPMVLRADNEKLMEFSWISNPFMNYIAGLLQRKPMRICFVGDKLKTIPDYQEKYDSCMRFYPFAWELETRETRVGSIKDYRDMDEREETVVDADSVDQIMDHGFIIDRDRLEYIDLEAYVRMYSDGIWCVNPLGVLAAAGTGYGGGDYRREDSNFGMTGIWAGDVISYSLLRPDDSYADMTEVYGFTQSLE